MGERGVRDVINVAIDIFAIFCGMCLIYILCILKLLGEYQHGQASALGLCFATVRIWSLATHLNAANLTV